ncbi:neprilysin-2 isoform X2 [Tetranychus urticae]|uniref:neprilysin-2 isoform X2 n=1 Tax=Tetranychus urticae TaxID=32264 RepID=UPI00077C0A10|nr:neprilysin-2 isoform X2 [Tetranychus urticae]
MDQPSTNRETVTQSDLVHKPNWWHRRTRLERRLISLFIGLTIFILSGIITLTIFIVAKDAKDADDLKYLSSSSNEQYCLTPGCVKAAARILDNLDTSVSPCDDFYDFACGGWIKKKFISEDQTGITQFGAIRDDLNRKLRELVENDGDNSNEAIYFKMMRTVYKQCMNLSEINEQSKGEVIKDIVDLGGWPLIEGPTWREAEFDWIEALKKMRAKGYDHNIFLSIYVSPDVKNNSRHIIEIDQAYLGVPDRKYLLKGMNDSTVKAYYKAIVDSASYIGQNSKEAIEKGASEIIDFETQLAKYSLPSEERRNFTKMYHKIQLIDLKRIGPNIDWPNIVRSMMVVNVSDNEEINVKVPRFLRSVDTLIANTDKRILANYMIWRAVFSALPSAEEPLRKISEAYSRVISGRKTEKPRWDTCMKRLYSSFGTPLSALYVSRNFDEKSRKQAASMVDYIRGQFIASLKKIDWMDEATRAKAIEKAEEMFVQIGYPPELLDESKVMSIYEGINISDDTKYYHNVQKLRKFWTDYGLQKLREPLIKDDWKRFSEAATVNAFNNFIENSIKFPAGILQGVFYDRERPNYLNYGGIGYIIGHEITHGFDDRGRQFDKNGNNRNWWEPETEKNFASRVRCIIEQYGNYTVDEVKEKVNGINTQGENIADNGGLKQAYLGYLKYIEDNGPEPLLPGVSMNQQQLFWIGAANIWCSKLRPQSMKLRIATGVHSPAKFRVNGPLSNMEHFSETFNCPKGSPMNPERKCNVW